MVYVLVKETIRLATERSWVLIQASDTRCNAKENYYNKKKRNKGRYMGHTKK